MRTGNINHWQQNEKLCATSRRNNKIRFREAKDGMEEGCKEKVPRSSRLTEPKEIHVKLIYISINGRVATSERSFGLVSIQLNTNTS